MDPRDPTLLPYVDALQDIAELTPDGKRVYWRADLDARTMFYGAGRSRDVETTALATLALLSSGRHSSTARAALTWLVSQKDGQGTWYSTQATVLALKALLAGTGKSLGQPVERRIRLEWDGQPEQQIVIPADQADVMRQIDLSSRFTAGQHALRLTDESGQSAAYQVTARYNVPESSAPVEDASLAINVSYDRTDLKVDDILRAEATVSNRLPTSIPMVIVDVPIPAGFTLDASQLDALVAAGHIAKYQLTPTSAILYLRDLAPKATLTLNYDLRATMPVKVEATPAVVYEYYNPDHRATSSPATLAVSAR